MCCIPNLTWVIDKSFDWERKWTKVVKLHVNTSLSFIKKERKHAFIILNNLDRDHELEQCPHFMALKKCRLMLTTLYKTVEWILHSISIYEVKRFHSLRSEFHSILTPVEWKFTTQRVKSRPVHSIFTPKEVITAWRHYQRSENRVNRVISFREYVYSNK